MIISNNDVHRSNWGPALNQLENSHRTMHLRAIQTRRRIELQRDLM